MARVKKQEHEKITDANISRVVGMLEAENPITKKEACDILGITYNTTRLTRIIEEWKSDKEYRDKRKAERRGKAASKEEIAIIAQSHLDGDPISEIAKRTYRSSGFVKGVIERVGIPTRPSGDEKHKPAVLPDQCIAENFSVGEIAWSAIYHAPCEIRAKLPELYNVRYTVPCYRVWILENSPEAANKFGETTGGFNAYVPAYDLGKLNHLEEYGVKVNSL